MDDTALLRLKTQDKHLITKHYTLNYTYSEIQTNKHTFKNYTALQNITVYSLMT
jgi:hypothetical protein